jgi:hypothetical protein
MKELSDEPEIEVKFALPAGSSHSAALPQIARAFDDDVRLVHTLPSLVVDYYFDTPELDLARTGASLRLRRRKSAPGFNANFKTPSEADDERFLTRQEIRSRLTVAEATDFARGLSCEGKALSHAAKFVEHVNGSIEFQHKLCLTTFRDVYVVQPAGARRHSDHYLLVLFDHAMVHDIRGSDVVRLLDEGLRVWAGDGHHGEFRELEIEYSVTGECQPRRQEAMEIFRNVIANVVSGGGVALSTSKYQRGLQEVGLIAKTRQGNG